MALRRRSIKDTRGEATLFRVRAMVGFALILLGLAVLVVRYHYLQVQRHDEFALRSENNRVKPCQRSLPKVKKFLLTNLMTVQLSTKQLLGNEGLSLRSSLCHSAISPKVRRIEGLGFGIFTREPGSFSKL